MRGFLKSFFGASGKEVNGIFLLIIILIIALFYPRIHNFFARESVYLPHNDQLILDSLITYLETNESSDEIQRIEVNFDPNSTPLDSLLLLGFSTQAANQIVNYRTKGGRFIIKSDLYKIYAIDSSLVNKLYPFITLTDQISTIEKKAVAKKVLPSKHKHKIVIKASSSIDQQFDINKADTAMLQTVSGIGSVLSARIISFRNKLGGFVRPEQLYEVYNLDSIVVNNLLAIAYIDPTFKPINLQINKATEEELRGHPYLNRNQARLIVAYRNQHGDFLGRQDLAKVYGMDEITLRRIMPYISWGPSI